MGNLKNIIIAISLFAKDKKMIICYTFAFIVGIIIASVFLNNIHPIVNGIWFVNGYYAGCGILVTFIVAAFAAKTHKAWFVGFLVAIFVSVGVIASCSVYKFCSPEPSPVDTTVTSTPPPVQSPSPIPTPLPTPEVTHEPVENDPLEISTIIDMAKKIKTQLKSNTSTKTTTNLDGKYDDLILKAKNKEDDLLSKSNSTYDEWSKVLNFRLNALEYDKNRTIYFLIANTYMKMGERTTNIDLKKKMYKNAVDNFENSLNSWNAFKNDAMVSEFLGNYGVAISILNELPEMKSISNVYKAAVLFEMSCDYKLNESSSLAAAQKYCALGLDRNDKDSYKYYLNAEKMLNKITKADITSSQRAFSECYKQIYFELQKFIDNYKVIEPMKDKDTYENYYKGCTENLNSN